MAAPTAAAPAAPSGAGCRTTRAAAGLRQGPAATAWSRAGPAPAAAGGADLGAADPAGDHAPNAEEAVAMAAAEEEEGRGGKERGGGAGGRRPAMAAGGGGGWEGRGGRRLNPRLMIP